MADCIPHLQRCVDILERERDPKKWPPLIAALPTEAREPVRLWLLAYSRAPLRKLYCRRRRNERD